MDRKTTCGSRRTRRNSAQASAKDVDVSETERTGKEELEKEIRRETTEELASVDHEKVEEKLEKITETVQEPEKTSDGQDIVLSGLTDLKTKRSVGEKELMGRTTQNGQDNEGVSVKRKKKVAAVNNPSKSIPRGKPKSGRVWKENKKRFSSMVKDRPLRTSWDTKMKVRQEMKMIKSLAQELKDEKQREKEEKKKRREENLRRRLENERKAEVVQVIRNPTKLKRARKKQLRNIQKRDTLVMSQAGKKSQKKATPS